MIARFRFLQERTAWLDADRTAQSSLALLVVGLTLVASVLAVVLSSAPSATSKVVTPWVGMPIALALILYSTADLYYARIGRVRPWWVWLAALTIRKDKQRQRWLIAKARRAHLCESKERLHEPNHALFVDALMHMDGAA